MGLRDSELLDLEVGDSCSSWLVLKKEPDEHRNPSASSLFTSNLSLPEMEFAKGLQKMANSCKQTFTQEVWPQ